MAKIKLNTDGNFKLVVTALVGIATDLVTIISFGLINPNWRANVLFSEWFLEDKNEIKN